MRFLWFEVSNFKSFFQPQRLELRQGFNIITGKNNAGKSALLHALSLSIPNQPHRSLASMPSRDAQPDGASIIRFGLLVQQPELRVLVERTISSFTIPYDPRGGTGRDVATQLLSRILEMPELRIEDVAIIGGGYSYSAVHTAWPYPVPQQGAVHANFQREARGPLKYMGDTIGAGPSALDTTVASLFAPRVYLFEAERMNVGTYPYGGAAVLNPNAENLPQVLVALQGRNPPRFERFNQLVRRVLPEIRAVTIRPHSTNSANAEIVVWDVEPSTEREDLATPLSECGTGISQVLAMLYVLVTADMERVLIIDEPNSFLHPGAARALMEILRGDQRHQYIISTHSPQIISDAPSPTIYLLRKSQATSVSQITPGDADQARALLIEIGTRLSDVFTAEKILWVEGRTEEQCFPLIAKSQDIALRGTSIVGVQHTGDFDRRNARWALRLYTRLSRGYALIPPAVGFIFDQEERSDRERESIERESRGAVRFLPRRMYENYLLDADAVAWLVQSLDSSAIAQRVADVLSRKLAAEEYYPAGLPASPAMVDGALLLTDLVSECTDRRHEYSKVEHGVALTGWLLEHKPEALAEIAALLEAVLTTPEARA